MKIAFATQDLKRVDAHFGWAKNIAIYEIGPEGHRFLEAVQFDGDLKEDGNEDKLAPKIDAIKDCAILYVAAIGGSGRGAGGREQHPSDEGQPARRDHRSSGKAGRCPERDAAAVAAQGAGKGQGTESSISKNEG